MHSTIFAASIGRLAHMGVTTIGHKSTIKEALDVMLQNNLRDVIFEVDSEYRIFTTSDLIEYMKHSNDFSIALDQLPRHPLHKVFESESVVDAFAKFEDSSNRYLGVTNKEQSVIGVVSYSDIIAALDPSIFIQKKRIRDVIRPSHRIAVPSETLTHEILSYLADVENAVVIVSATNIPIGILTAKDALKIALSGSDSDRPVSDYMTSPVDTVIESFTINQVIEYLQDTGFKRAIIVDENNSFLGTVTQSDMSSYTFNHWAEIVQGRTTELNEMTNILRGQVKSYEKDAVTDPLTGIGNRRKFNDIYNKETARFNRYQNTPFSIIMLDIDHFKRINDQHGHSKGDEALVEFVSTIKPLLRENDSFCRWGGEEFAIILPETDSKGALILAERIREAISQITVGSIMFTVSAGVAQYREKELLDEFIMRLDGALYQAKENGRNRVVSSV